MEGHFTLQRGRDGEEGRREGEEGKLRGKEERKERGGGREERTRNGITLSNKAEM